MGLTHNELIIIDVTTIIGLFFFITFQSFNPPIVDDINNYWNTVYDVEIELEALVNSQPDCYDEKYDFYNKTQCSDLRIKKYELLNKYEALKESGVYYGYTTSSAYGPSSYVDFILRTPLYMYWISILMISPFVLSVIVESIETFRKKDEPATKAGMKLMMIGFFAIIVGLSIIAGLFYFANEPWYSGDLDRDGLKREDELYLGTDPKNPDTDGDGLLDGEEWFYYFTDPTTENLSEDRFKNIGGEKDPACQGTAECFVGVVRNVIDGYTFEIQNVETDSLEKIRLSLVDKPKENEPLFETAKKFSEKFCPVNSYVLFDEDDGQTEGSFGNKVGKLYCEGKKIHILLLERDLAKIDTRFCSISEYREESWAQKYGCNQ